MMQKSHSQRFSIAPMMDWTDRHCRAFHRELTQCALLFSEMVTADAVIHGDRDRLLGYSDVEHPIVLQLGGNEPQKLAEAARIGEDFGYDEINLNCGCPSDRVQSGAFGACLMRDAALVAECVAAMSEAVKVPVTVKHRIGVDDDEPRDRLFEFVETLKKNSACTVFHVHARKAWLKGLSPKENREIPPLDYGLVHELKQAHPDLTIVLNGGLTDLETCNHHLQELDGVMLGRAAYHHPAVLLKVDSTLFGRTDRHDDMHSALRAYRSYLVSELDNGTPLHSMTRHLLGAFAGMPGARSWRRHLSENATKSGSSIAVFDEALAMVPQQERVDV